MREVVRVLVQSVSMGVRGGRIGVLALLAAVVLAAMVAATATAVVPVAVYPFL